MLTLRAMAACGLAVVAVACVGVGGAYATDYYVDGSAPAGGDGSVGSPFQTIQQGLNVAYAGDDVIVRDGTYTVSSTLNFPRSGAAGSPITLKAADGETVIVMRNLASNIRLVETARSYITIDGLVFDSQYGTENGLMRFEDPGAFQTLRNCEIRRHGNHIVRLNSDDFLMEDCVVHHAISPGLASDGLADAHCLHSETGHRHTFRRCEIYMATGDLWQGSRDGQWTDIVFDDCDMVFTLADADAASASSYITVGQAVTENHFDTKALAGSWVSGPMTVKHSRILNSKLGRISTAAAFNLKDACEGFEIFGNVIENNDVAFRLRYPSSDYLVYNNVISNSNVGVRLEDGISGLAFANNTFYNNNEMVRDDGGAPTNLTFTNNIFMLASSQSTSNWWGVYTHNLFWQVAGGWPAVTGNWSDDPELVAAAGGDFHLQATSPAIEGGVTVAEVTVDFDGVVRPQGSAYDIGAYEFVVARSLVAADPAHDSTFAKQEANVIRLTFDGPIALPTGAALTIVPVAGGSDWGGAFSYAVEPDGVTLKATEIDGLLPKTSPTWYRIGPGAGLAAQAFAVDVCTLIGDADANGQVLAGDLGRIWAHNAEFTDARYDINGDGQVLAADLGVAWAHNAEATPVKP